MSRVSTSAGQVGGLAGSYRTAHIMKDLLAQTDARYAADTRATECPQRDQHRAQQGRKALVSDGSVSPDHT